MGKKLFVGGVPKVVTDEQFKEYFSGFGEVEDCILMKDKFSGTSRGFGFVTYADKEVFKTVKNQEHAPWEDKKVDVKAAQPRGQAGMPRVKKIFVGGLDKEQTTVDSLKAYFE